MYKQDCAEQKSVNSNPIPCGDTGFISCAELKEVVNREVTVSNREEFSIQVKHTFNAIDISLRRLFLHVLAYEQDLAFELELGRQ